MDNKNKVNGAEAILIHNGNIVLGMQQPQRWYELENGNKAAIIKTIGGEVEEEDNNNTRNAVYREIIEEVDGISKENLKISSNPIFTKKVEFGELNPYDKNSDLELEADFYVAEIKKSGSLEPNDLPALIEIPIDKFLKMKFGYDDSMRCIASSVTKNTKLYQDIELPEQYSIMAPDEIKCFLQRLFPEKER